MSKPSNKSGKGAEKMPAQEAQWMDATSAPAASRAFFKFDEDAYLNGVVVGVPRTLKTRYGDCMVRDVDASDGERLTVAPKAFCRQILELPAGTEIRLDVTGGGGSADDPWRGTLRYRKPDVPF